MSRERHKISISQLNIGHKYGTKYSNKGNQCTPIDRRPADFIIHWNMKSHDDNECLTFFFVDTREKKKSVLMPIIVSTEYYALKSGCASTNGKGNADDLKLILWNSIELSCLSSNRCNAMCSMWERNLYHFRELCFPWFL